MKIHIEVDENVTEAEVIIKCKEISQTVLNIQNAVQDITSSSKKLFAHIGETQYYIKLDLIVFIQTDNKTVNVHTKNEMYSTDYKLYELEDILPGNFMRVSKSCILNTNYIFSIQKNIASSSVVEFQNTYKQVYVSRNYYKPLRLKLEEKAPMRRRNED